MNLDLKKTVRMNSFMPPLDISEKNSFQENISLDSNF